MDKQEVNPGHFHEIADRCYLVNCIIDDHVNKSDYFLKWIKALIKRRENEKEKAERGSGSTAGKLGT